MRYCKLCRIYYQDWLKHVGSPVHRAARERQPLAEQLVLDEEAPAAPAVPCPVHYGRMVPWWWRPSRWGNGGEWLCTDCHPPPEAEHAQ